MVMSTALVAAVSHGQIVVSDSGAFTTAIFDLLEPDAKSLLDQEEEKANHRPKILPRKFLSVFS